MGRIYFERITPIMREHLPEILTGIGLAGTVMTGLLTVKQYENEAAHWKLMYDITGSEIYLLRYLQMTKTNNWLKMHGYPMRRKRRH